ncbi:zinc-dependent alcohol dehydrogenase family protein [Heyndrickxia sp. NPDC080065]|uniref:zinc-dependent alcohol dehydrogenase family protein n=1 Tax=Heyndrickxia sp. NPDC080065 TaxID=3390568 RepID=UPI003D08664F
MKATSIMFHEFGNPEEVLRLVNKSVKPPSTGEILVRMKMSPINPSDLIPIRGAYAHRISLPTIPGYEGVGVVEEVGPSVSQDLIGKRVLPLRGEGTWQGLVRAPAELAVPIPDSIEDHIAAQLYINPMTAWVTCTEILELGPGDVLVMNAAGSAIGRIFAQLSQIIGFQFIAVTRNNHYTDELLQLGAAHVIDTSNTSLQEMVMELTDGRGASAAIDSIGGTEGTKLAFCVRPNGNFLTIGLLSGIPIQWKKVSESTKLNIKLFHLRHWNAKVSVQTWQETFQTLIHLIENKSLTLGVPDSFYPIEKVKKAVRAAESTSRNGMKVFLTFGLE